MKITREQEIDLLTRAQSGERSAENKVIEQYRPYAYQYAKKWSQSGADIDDLRQAALIGILKASRKYDATRGVRFLAYAKYWVTTYVQREARKSLANGFSGGSMGGGRYQKFQRAYNALGDGADADSIVALLGCERATAVGFLSLRQAVKSIDTSHFVDGRPMGEVLPGSGPTAEDNAITAERNCKLHAAIRRLPELHRDVLMWTFFDDSTYERLGRHWQVSRERIRQIREEALDSLAVELAKDRTRGLRVVPISMARSALERAGVE